VKSDDIASEDTPVESADAFVHAGQPEALTVNGSGRRL